MYLYVCILKEVETGKIRSVVPEGDKQCRNNEVIAILAREKTR